MSSIPEHRGPMDRPPELNHPDDVQVLIVADEGEKYGNNWLLCVTPAAREEQLKVVADREAAKKAIEDAKQAEIDRKKAEEAALLTRVWKDEPLRPRPWATETAAETVEEVRRQQIRPARALLRTSITRKRREFGAACKFNDRDAEQSGLFEFRQHKDPNYDLRRQQLDASLQACPSYVAGWKPLSAWGSKHRRNTLRTTKKTRSCHHNPQFSMPKIGLIGTASLATSVPRSTRRSSRRQKLLNAWG